MCVCVRARFRRYHISQALRVRTYVHACQPLKLIPFFPLSVTTDRLDRFSRLAAAYLLHVLSRVSRLGVGLFVAVCHWETVRHLNRRFVV